MLVHNLRAHVRSGVADRDWNRHAAGRRRKRGHQRTDGGDIAGKFRDLGSLTGVRYA